MSEPTVVEVPPVSTEPRPDRMTAMRLTTEELNGLKREASGLGLTLQQLFELRMLGAARPARRAGRRKRTSQDEELPIAG